MKNNRPVLKQTAKRLIAETKPNPIVVALIFVLILFVLEYLNTRLNGYEQLLNELSMNYYSGQDLSLYIPKAPNISWYASVTIILISLMYFMMNVGFSIYCLNVAKKTQSGFANLFDSFNIFLKVLWLHILVSIFVFLWSLLFIIPGIVASYRYRQALFIMIENPQLSALECIRASKNMMYSHKVELFVMDLSFLGWQLLQIVPFVSIWVLPYTQITYAVYYVALRDIPADSQVV